MKIKFLFLLSIVMITLNSCKENSFAVFTEPQPADVKNMEGFPNKLLGNYINPESKIKIEKHLVSRIYTVQDTVNREEYFMIDDDEKKFFTSFSDSLYIGKYQIIDTLLNLKNKDVLKKFKGNFYLNKYHEGLWSVKQLHVKSNYIIFAEIQNMADMEILNEITNANNLDSIYPKSFELNKRQFKEFIKKNGFSESNTFIKE